MFYNSLRKVRPISQSPKVECVAIQGKCEACLYCTTPEKFKDASPNTPVSSKDCSNSSWSAVWHYCPCVFFKPFEEVCAVCVQRFECYTKVLSEV